MYVHVCVYLSGGCVCVGVHYICVYMCVLLVVLYFYTVSSDFQTQCNIISIIFQGVWFRKFYLIVWQGTVEVPEAVLRTVRLAVTAKDVEYARVRVAVLVFAVQEGIEYIVNVVSTNYIFSTDDNLLNLDDILPFDNLNNPPVSIKLFFQTYIIMKC